MKKNLIITAVALILLALWGSVYAMYTTFQSQLYRAEMIAEELRAKTPEAILAKVRNDHKMITEENIILDKEIQTIQWQRNDNDKKQKELEVKSLQAQALLNTWSTTGWKLTTQGQAE